MQYIMVMFVVASLGLLPGASWAAQPEHELHGELWQCVVPRSESTFNILAHPKVMTAFFFPGEIVDTLNLYGGPADFLTRRSKNILLLSPASIRSSKDATLSLVVKLAEPDWTIHLWVRVASAPEQALRACRFVSREELQASRDPIHPGARHGLEAHRPGERLEPFAMARDRLTEDGELEPRIRAMTGTSGDVDIELGRGIWIGPEYWTLVSFHNRDWRPYRLTHVQASSSGGHIMPIEDIRLDPPARPGDRIIAEIPSAQRVLGVMRIPGVAGDTELRTISFRGNVGHQTLFAVAEEPVWIYVPKRKEDIQKEEAEKAREEAEKAAFGVVTLSLQGSYGAIWLGDGAGLDMSRATSSRGLGARITYGLGQLFAVEGELTGATTGEARFADALWEGVQGDLARSAWLGRAQFGAVLRLVHDEGYQPVLRAGVGLQGASHSAWHDVNGVRMDGPDVPFEWTFLFSFGAGLDLLFGPLRAGVSLSGVTPFGDLGAGLYRGAIEAGAHIGLRWN